MQVQETEWCAELLAERLRASQAAAQGLGPSVQCCAVALAHAQELQASHSLALAPRLLRRLWPVCQEVRRYCPCSNVACSQLRCSRAA